MNIAQLLVFSAGLAVCVSTGVRAQESAPPAPPEPNRPLVVEEDNLAPEPATLQRRIMTIEREIGDTNAQSERFRKLIEIELNAAGMGAEGSIEKAEKLRELLEGMRLREITDEGRTLVIEMNDTDLAREKHLIELELQASGREMDEARSEMDRARNELENARKIRIEAVQRMREGRLEGTQSKKNDIECAHIELRTMRDRLATMERELAVRSRQLNELGVSVRTDSAGTMIRTITIALDSANGSLANVDSLISVALGSGSSFGRTIVVAADSHNVSVNVHRNGGPAMRRQRIVVNDGSGAQATSNNGRTIIVTRTHGGPEAMAHAEAADVSVITSIGGGNAEAAAQAQNSEAIVLSIEKSAHDDAFGVAEGSGHALANIVVARGRCIIGGDTFMLRDGANEQMTIRATHDSSDDGSRHITVLTITRTKKASDAAAAEVSAPTMKDAGGYALGANVPNPFSESTSISFTLPTAGHATLSVFDANGQTVKVLADGHYAAGTHNVVFNAEGLPSGLYLYRLVSGSVTETKTMTITK